MLVTKRSELTGREHTLDIPVTPEQLANIENRGNLMIQDVASFLSPDHREFLLTGITPEEWTAVFHNGGDE